jgi:hypothetical protein
MSPMPQYQCHKKVWALKIQSVRSGDVRNGDAKVHLHFEDKRYAPRPVSFEWAHKFDPQAGGYFVQYEDGYESYSPAKAFEEGYTRL